MENNQNIFLDKVIEFLVRDTKIDYDKEEIQFPFRLTNSFSRFLYQFCFVSQFSPQVPSPFPKYCKSVYGLTDQEVDYVWDQYKDIILDKITNK